MIHYVWRRLACGVGPWISHRRSQFAKANLECVKGCETNSRAFGVVRSLAKPPFPQILTTQRNPSIGNPAVNRHFTLTKKIKKGNGSIVQDQAFASRNWHPFGARMRAAPAAAAVWKRLNISYIYNLRRGKLLAKAPSLPAWVLLITKPAPVKPTC